jgi:hypothetical protein
MAVQVTIYLNESDKWQGKPLHMAILNYLREENVFAATTLHAVGGFLGRQRVKTSHLVDAGGRNANRAGLGISVMFSRWFSLDFEMLPRRDADARSYLLTMTTATYSDFLGGGRRRFFNPYLGLRAGGAKLNGFNGLAYGADVGLEIVRFKLFLVEISGRAMGLWYHRDNPPTSDIVLEGLLGVGVPF